MHIAFATAPLQARPAVAASWPIEVRGLSKRFGSILAVDDLTFTVEPGRVTGFLGPNGAGKTTTLRLILGLLRPTAGSSFIGGLGYGQLPEPLRVVGAGLDGSSFHPGRTGRNHLRWVAAAGGFSANRVDEVLALVSLAEAANQRVGGYSLGMRQRLALAQAMLGDPRVLILDEPANGLDPEGIAWLRSFLRWLADEGRTVLVSSHVLSEVQQTVDDVVIIARGRMIQSGPLSDLGGAPGIEVASPDPTALHEALVAAGFAVGEAAQGRLLVDTHDAGAVGAAAFSAGVQLQHLAPADTDLEQTFLRLVAETGTRTS